MGVLAPSVLGHLESTKVIVYKCVYKCEYRELVKQLYSETYGKGPYKKRMYLERTVLIS